MASHLNYHVPYLTMPRSLLGCHPTRPLRSRLFLLTNTASHKAMGN